MVLALVSIVRSHSCQRIVSLDLMAAILVGVRNGGHFASTRYPLGIKATCRLPLVKSLSKDNDYGNENPEFQ